MTTFSDDQLLNLTPEELKQLTPAQLARRQDLIYKKKVSNFAISKANEEQMINPISPISDE